MTWFPRFGPFQAGSQPVWGENIAEGITRDEKRGRI